MRRLDRKSVAELAAFLEKLLRIRYEGGYSLPPNAEAVLVYLRLQQPEGRASLTDLQKGVRLSRWQLRRLLEALDRQGLVRKASSSGDGRERDVVLTPEGCRLVDLFFAK